MTKTTNMMGRDDHRRMILYSYTSLQHVIGPRHQKLYGPCDIHRTVPTASSAPVVPLRLLEPSRVILSCFLPSPSFRPLPPTSSSNELLPPHLQPPRPLLQVLFLGQLRSSRCPGTATPSSFPRSGMFSSFPFFSFTRHSICLRYSLLHSVLRQALWFRLWLSILIPSCAETF